MRLITGSCLCATVLAALVACGPGEATSPADLLPEAVDGCPQVQVIGVRGQSQSLEAHRGLGTEVDGVATALEKTLRADGVDEVDVDAIRHRSRNAAELGTYEEDVDEGRTKLRERLQQSVEDCPDARIVVLGFSQGAQISQETLAGDDDLASHVSALGVLGSPRHDPEAPVHELDLAGPTAAEPGSLGAGPDLGALYDRTVDACLDGDVVCSFDGGEDLTIHKHGYEDADVAAAMADALAPLVLDDAED